MIHIGSQEKLGLQSFPTKSEELMLTRKLINFLCYESGLNQCTLSFDYHRVLKPIQINRKICIIIRRIFVKKKMIKIALDRGYILRIR